MTKKFACALDLNIMTPYHFEIMKKTGLYLTASIASVAYFIIAIILRYSPDENILDLRNTLIGAVVFGVVFFLLHPFIYKRVKS
jgi:hypothetical protein